MTQTMTAPTATGQPVYEITDADKARQKAIAEAWRAYDGDFDPQLEKTPEGIDPNVVIEQCGVIVDGGVDFLFGLEVEISAEKAAPAEAQTLLDQVWGKKEVRIPLLQELAMNGALGRNAFLRIMPSTDEITRATTYRLVPVDPAIVSMQTAPQDCDTVLLYCLQYSTSEKDPDTGKPRQVWYREEIMRIDPDGNAKQDRPDDDDTWQIQHWTQVGYANMEPKADNWIPAGEPILWNYPFPPLFHCKNLPRPNDPWGRADIRPALIGLNKALNLVMTCTVNDEIIYGLPIIYGTGIGSAPIERKAGYIIPLEIPDAKIAAVAIPTDIPNALAVAMDLRSSMDEASGIPGVATGRISSMPRGNLSGIAIELLFERTIKQTDKKRCLYGKLMIDVSKALLVLSGMSKDIDITLAWQSPLPHDDLPSIQAGVSLGEIGVSKTTRMRNLGYDPEEEAKLRHSPIETALNEPTIPPPPLPAEIPGAPLLPGQPPPAKPAAPGQAPVPAQGGKQP